MPGAPCPASHFALETAQALTRWVTNLVMGRRLGVLSSFLATLVQAAPLRVPPSGHPPDGLCGQTLKLLFAGGARRVWKSRLCPICRGLSGTVAWNPTSFRYLLYDLE